MLVCRDELARRANHPLDFTSERTKTRIFSGQKARICKKPAKKPRKTVQKTLDRL
jgi:hypothetical protein